MLDVSSHGHNQRACVTPTDSLTFVEVAGRRTRLHGPRAAEQQATDDPSGGHHEHEGQIYEREQRGDAEQDKHYQRTDDNNGHDQGRQ
jgi:hypothetical protein